ncbi:protein MEMO1 isoform X1 [Prinia subflava]|uniref:protein MEMO1 isoform X1 n=1 Tax=Prinia subflava TaxID=208062 RepID=UPI002FE1F056
MLPRASRHGQGGAGKDPSSATRSPSAAKSMFPKMPLGHGAPSLEPQHPSCSHGPCRRGDQRGRITGRSHGPPRGSPGPPAPLPSPDPRPESAPPPRRHGSANQRARHPSPRQRAGQSAAGSAARPRPLPPPPRGGAVLVKAVGGAEGGRAANHGEAFALVPNGGAAPARPLVHGSRAGPNPAAAAASFSPRPPTRRRGVGGGGLGLCLRVPPPRPRPVPRPRPAPPRQRRLRPRGPGRAGGGGGAAPPPPPPPRAGPSPSAPPEHHRRLRLQDVQPGALPGGQPRRQLVHGLRTPAECTARRLAFSSTVHKKTCKSHYCTPCRIYLLWILCSPCLQTSGSQYHPKNFHSWAFPSRAPLPMCTFQCGHLQNTSV